ARRIRAFPRRSGPCPRRQTTVADRVRSYAVAFTAVPAAADAGAACGSGRRSSSGGCGGEHPASEAAASSNRQAIGRAGRMAFSGGTDRGLSYAPDKRPEVRMASQRWTLDGQRALVTGASAGIGLAICRELLGLGAQVLMVARDAELLETARAELEDEFPGPEDAVLALPADVTDEEQRAEILDWAADHGGLHVLVNNAGGNVTRPALDYGEDQWRGIFETN